MITSYIHHDVEVFVEEDLRGTHRLHCLCYKCESFKPKSRDLNCSIANKLYQICVDESIVTPVFECPKFIPKQAN